MYSTNAHHSQSINSKSSSDNYVGNVFYEHGTVVLTETGSWSGSINYTDVSTDKYILRFDSTDTIYVQEYIVNVMSADLNGTNNPTATSGSSGRKINSITRSEWSPFITTVGLYDEDNELVSVGKISQPVQTIDWGQLNFKIRFDM